MHFGFVDSILNGFCLLFVGKNARQSGTQVPICLWFLLGVAVDHQLGVFYLLSNVCAHVISISGFRLRICSLCLLWLLLLVLKSPLGANC